MIHERLARVQRPLLRLPSARSASPDALRLHAAWLRQTGLCFNPDRMPWVPLGAVGPILVMGHCSPELADQSPVPHGCFQPFLITTSDYESLLQETARRLDASPSGARLLAPPTVGPRPDGVMTPAEAVRHLLTCHVLTQDQRERLQELPRHCRSFQEIPDDLAPAAWFAAGRGPVLARCQMPEEASLPIAGLPAELSAQVRLVHQEGTLFHLAANRLPAEELEDRLLVHLPEDARVEWYWLPHPPETTQASQTRTAKPSGKVTATARGTEQVEGPVTLSLESDRLRSFDPRNIRATGLELFHWLLYRALEEGASDLHIEPGIGAARARLRVHGDLVEILELPDATCRTVVGAAKAAVGLASENFRPLDGACSVALGPGIWNVRVNAYPIRRDYQKLVLRFLPRRSRSLGFADLLQPEDVVRRFRHAVSRPQGLILVCGPTGSGKTTTLMTCLSEINRPDLNITTLEDPVEYEIQGLNQAEIDSARRVGWQELLPAVLRQDPDVILIGEVRDRATAETALRAALTGHLVFATLHTLSSCKAVQRLADLGINTDMLAESLVMIQSQRLLTRLCPKCREVRAIDEEQRTLLGRHPNASQSLRSEAIGSSARAGGCAACSGRGTAGRIAAMELLPVDEAFAEAISRGARAMELQRLSTQAGHATLFEAALRHAASGQVSWAEARSEQANWEGYV